MQRDAFAFCCKEQGQEAVCRFLVQECQADVNARDADQETPIAFGCAERGHEAVCRFLVKACQGADVNAQSNSLQRTPLHVSSK